MKHYDDKLKEQVIKECQEVGNISLVAKKELELLILRELSDRVNPK